MSDYTLLRMLPFVALGFFGILALIWGLDAWRSWRFRVHMDRVRESNRKQWDEWHRHHFPPRTLNP